jgi:drug/metabolite transporter (DMT)-like permease
MTQLAEAVVPHGVDVSRTGLHRAFFFTALCVLAWSTIPAIAEKVAMKQMDQYDFFAWANLVSACTLLVAAVRQKRHHAFRMLSKTDVLASSTLGIVGCYLYYTLLFEAYRQTPDSGDLDVLACQYTWPVFTVVFSAVLSDGRIKAKEVGSLVLAFTSVVVIAVARRGNVPTLRAAMLALLAAALFGLFSAVTKFRNRDVVAVNLIYFISASVAGIFVSVFFRSHHQVPSSQEVLLIALYGILVNGLSYLWWFRALSLARAATVAPFVMATPILAALVLHFYLGRPLDSMAFLSVVGVTAAGALAVT